MTGGWDPGADQISPDPRVEELFAVLLEGEPEEREGSLNRLTEGDEELAGKVRVLLQELAAADRFLDVLAEGIATPGIAARAPVPLHPPTVGPYRLVSLLGRGGMGAVYLGERDDGQFEQRVAVKLLPPALASEAMGRRFAAERRILARLQHPGIARLLDGGVAPDGTPYIVMEFVEGEAIDRHCDRLRLDVDARLELFEQVAAVDHAHRSLVVHRDLKPSNILVTAEGQVKLLDFGIARVLDDDTGSGPTPLTRLGERPLTPAYASPEQLRGESVTTATDVYSLGVLLHLLLVGRHPHDEGQTPSERVRMILERPPRPASIAAMDGADAGERAALRSTSPGRLRRRLRGDLETILQVALRKEPERRYASVRELAVDLRRHRQGLTVSARPDSLGYRVRTLVRRHPWRMAGAVAGPVAVVGALMLHVDRLGAERDRARIEAEKAEQVSAFLQDLLTAPDPALSRGEVVTVREVLDRGRSRIGDELRGQPEVQARMMTLMGRTYLGLGLHGDARDLLLGALERQRALLPTPHPELAETLAALGVALQGGGELDEAEARYVEALSILEALQGPESPTSVRILYRLASMAHSRGSRDAADDWFDRWLSARGARRAPFDGGDAELLREVAQIRAFRGDPVGAVPIMEEAVAAARALRGEALHPEVASVLSDLAGILELAGDGEKAVKVGEEALAMARQLYGEGDHPVVVNLALDQGWRLGHVGRFREGLDLMAPALEGLIRIQGEDNPSTLPHLFNTGRLHYRAGGHEEGERRILRFVELQEHFQGPGSRAALLARLVLARLYGDSGRLEVMSALVDSISPPLRQVEVRGFWLSELEAAEGISALHRGRPGEAVELLRSAVQGHAASFGPRHWRAAELRGWLGEALLSAGLREKGIEELRRSRRELEDGVDPGGWMALRSARRLEQAGG